MQEKQVAGLLKECVKMSEFDHPNVLNLTGVCLDGGPAPYIIMPFMENGSLLTYLRKEKDTLISRPDMDNMQDVVMWKICTQQSHQCFRITAWFIPAQHCLP